MDVGAVAVRHEPASAALVRKAIAADLEAHSVARSCIEDVMLVASELVGNAVIHSGGTHSVDERLDIAWEIGTGEILVLVVDGSSTFPVPRPAMADEPNGRGLTIVSALSADWGFEPTPTGKKVWARVPITSR